MFRPSLWGFIVGPDPYTNFYAGDGSPADIAYAAWVAEGNILAQPGDQASNNITTRTSRMNDVSPTISVLEDLVEAGVATPDEITLLATCKQYRTALYQTDLTASPVVWPSNYPLPF